MPKQVTAENEGEFDDLEMAMFDNCESVQHRALQVYGRCVMFMSVCCDGSLHFPESLVTFQTPRVIR